VATKTGFAALNLNMRDTPIDGSCSYLTSLIFKINNKLAKARGVKAGIYEAVDPVRTRVRVTLTLTPNSRPSIGSMVHKG